MTAEEREGYDKVVVEFSRSSLMPTATLSPPVAPRPVTYACDPSIARATVAKYDRMVEAGIWADDDHVELLEGYVVHMMARNPLHDSTVQQSLEVLFPLRPPGWTLRVQSAVWLSDSKPEPDLALVRGTAATFRARHPRPDEIGLLIEVSESSLLRDRQDKARIYARDGIAVYWIINLIDRRVEVHTRPSGPTESPAYGDVQFHEMTDSVPLMLDGALGTMIPVADLIG